MADPAAGREAAEHHPRNREPGPDMAEVDDRGDARVPWRVFAAVGVFIAVLAVIYGVTAAEEAGATMLVLAAVLALWCGIFLWNNLRRFEAGHSGDPGGEDLVYAPEASPWPLGVGLGAALIINGLLIGTWFVVPGAMLLAVSVTGFASQSRHRR
ncbi:hypothetical protein BH20ACT3_BH20ACT3_15170 [soil metagenome]